MTTDNITERVAEAILEAMDLMDGLDIEAATAYAEAAMRVIIPSDWTPTPENINALPFPLRKYIHALETECDPQGTIRQNVLLKDENRMLRAECERLAPKTK